MSSKTSTSDCDTPNRDVQGEQSSESERESLETHSSGSDQHSARSDRKDKATKEISNNQHPVTTPSDKSGEQAPSNVDLEKEEHGVIITGGDHTVGSHSDPGKVTPNTKESNPKSGSPSKSRTKKSRKTKKMSVDEHIKREVKAQLSKYFNEERRLLGFNPKLNDPTSSHIQLTKSTKEKKVYPAPSTATVPKAEKKRLSRFARKTIKELDLDQIWKFHAFRVGLGQPKTTQNGFVQNYSRHMGNILHSVEYKQLYDELTLKKS